MVQVEERGADADLVTVSIPLANKALAEKQKITAIYAVMGSERVLLSAVAQGDNRK